MKLSMMTTLILLAATFSTQSVQAAGACGAAAELTSADARVSAALLEAPFDPATGWALHEIEGGQRRLVLSTSDAAADAAVDGERSVTALYSASPSKDTWTTVLSTGARVDFGRSCELQINNMKSTAQPARQALFQFSLPSTVTCSTITSGRLILKTGQAKPAAPMTVGTYMLTAAFTPGASGYSSCSSCKVSSGSTQAFVMPTFSTAGGTNVVKTSCTSYAFDITAMVKTWCSTPTRNFGVLVGGLDGSSVINFQSMESPLAADRPMLEIVY